MTPMITTFAIAPLLAAGTFGDVEFEAPVQIKAGESNFSEVLYPSPVIRDVDGDGQVELYIGDLRGYIQRADRISSGTDSEWGPAVNMKATDGKDLKFSNW